MHIYIIVIFCIFHLFLFFSDFKCLGFLSCCIGEKHALLFRLFGNYALKYGFTRLYDANRNTTDDLHRYFDPREDVNKMAAKQAWSTENITVSSF